ncbi:MAG: 2-oxoacid:acceptor oxidoreductase family protein [Minisyncoccales bacterium]
MLIIKMRLNILIAGKAGEGPNFLSRVISKGLFNKGYYVFNSRLYRSLIRGGINFNQISVSESFLGSNDSKVDLFVALSKEALEEHKDSLNTNGIALSPSSEELEKSNAYCAGKVWKTLGLDFKSLDKEFKNIGKKYEENVKDAKEGFNSVEEKIQLEKTMTG